MRLHVVDIDERAISSEVVGILVMTSFEVSGILGMISTHKSPNTDVHPDKPTPLLAGFTDLTMGSIEHHYILEISSQISESIS